MSEIDPRAIVSPSARLGVGVRIGPCAVVGDDVELGDGCVLEPHAVVKGPSKFGRNNHIHSFAIVGGDPQDLTYTGQCVKLEVGDSNDFREFCTVHRGTVKGGGVTRVGSNSLIMAYAHVGHDCHDRRPRDPRSMALNSPVTSSWKTTPLSVPSACCTNSLAWAATPTSGRAPSSRRTSRHSRRSSAPRDTRCYGINKVGLERNGFSPERIQAIEQAYRYLLRSKLNTSQAVEKMRGTLSSSEDVQTLVRFIESATDRGLTK